MTDPLLDVRHLTKSYRQNSGFGESMRAHRPRIVAVDDVSLTLYVGETLAIVGESGCGKTTLARLLLRLVDPDAGEIRFAGRDLMPTGGGALRALRRDMQMVFQDPYASLNPRMRVGEIVAEPLAIHEPHLSNLEKRERTAAMLERVGVASDALERYAHEFSGGQRQRIGIARALILYPKLVVADEPVSALDVSVGAQILELLSELQREFSLTYLLISHSLPVVAQLATHVAVMRMGRFVEVGTAQLILEQPADPYTQALLAAVPEVPHVSGMEGW